MQNKAIGLAALCTLPERAPQARKGYDDMTSL